MLNRLPENLIIEILSWLPVKSLLRSKSVKKSWYKIIKSPYFISMHLKHNYLRRTNCFFAQFIVTQAGELAPDLLWHGKSDPANTIHNYFSLQAEQPHNWNICGPCYGIYYLSDPWGDEARRLWNPALNEIKKLPPMNTMIMKPNKSSANYYNVCSGFGFDPVTKDYKVVIIKGYLSSTRDNLGYRTVLDYPLSIFIYSLMTDSWKYSGDLSKHYYISLANSCHTFVNRRFYWLGSDKEYTDKHDVIISIDLATEECQEIGLPDICIKESITRVMYSECLMVYKGSIALVAYYNEEYTFDIWTFKGTSWGKELRVELGRRVRNPVGHYNVDNNLVLFDGGRGLIIVCDANTKEISEVKGYITDGLCCKIVSAYMESLVPLNDRDFWDRGLLI